MLASPDSCVLLILLGAFLICWEFCRPGLVLPSSIGSFLVLGGFWQLTHRSPLMPALHLWVLIPPATLVALTIALLIRIAIAGRIRKKHACLDQSLSPRLR